MTVDLKSYDIILVNTSAGKDSQAMMDHLFWEALRLGIVDRLVAVHADLGKVEWEGTRELAERQAQTYGIRFMVATYQGSMGPTLLDYVRARKMWPDNKSRYCTSDFKRGPIRRVITALVTEHQARTGAKHTRVLNCMGLRAQESPARAKKVAFEHDAKASNGKRTVDTYLPILDWSVEKVWETIHASGVEYHRAYDLGMPRLSCMFCVFAPMSALVIAGKANPSLLQEYVDVEKEIGHTFRKDFSIQEVQQAIAAGAQVSRDDMAAWSM